MPKRLTKAELHWIETNPENLSVEDLAKELGFHKNIIQKYMKIKTIPKAEPKLVPEVRKSIPIDENADIRLGRRVRNGEVVATIMTPGASEVGDLAREKRGAPNLRDSLKNAIHKPKGNGTIKENNQDTIIKSLQDEIKRLKGNNV
jgi:hypothetical protein